MKWKAGKIALWFIGLSLVIYSCWATYVIFDQSITIDHCRQHLVAAVVQSDLLSDVLKLYKNNITQKEFEEYLAQHPKHDLFKKDANKVVVGNVTFIFSNNKLMEVVPAVK